MAVQTINRDIAAEVNISARRNDTFVFKFNTCVGVFFNWLHFLNLVKISLIEIFSLNLYFVSLGNNLHFVINSSRIYFIIFAICGACVLIEGK